MKKILLVLLTGVLVLSAVEWNIEEIPSDPDCFNVDPLIALDNQGHPRVLFIKADFVAEEAAIQLASKATGSWVIKDVATLLGFYNYSVDVDQEGNTYVAFSDVSSIEEDQYDIFLATDKTGEFVVSNLTEGDMNWQIIPVVQVDGSGDVTLLYYDETDTNIFLTYGWKDGEDFNRKAITVNVSYDDYHSIDLVLEQDNTPHAFYFDGDNDYIWHATPEDGPEGDWNLEQVNEQISYELTAAIDKSGYFHLSYDYDYGPLYYITNKTGSWTEETVADGSAGGNEEPSIAVDPQGNPHIAWLRTNEDYWYDICYGTKTAEGWTEELVTSTPADDEYPGVGHFFAIDNAGYGHLVYTFFDESEEQAHMYYAKSADPLSVGIAESSPQILRLGLEIRGSSIYFSLKETSLLRLDLYDAAGRLAKHLTSGTYEAGEHSIPINLDGFAAGVYFVRLESRNSAASAKIVKTK
jgi:hypothetical protein